MSVLNNPIAPPSEAYQIVERIFGGPRWFVHSSPPSPPSENHAAIGAGVRVQITGHHDRVTTQWDLRPTDWQELKLGLVTKAVSVRMVQTWHDGQR